MIIDSHGHVTAPAELYAYKAGLVSHRGAHGRGTPGISDELLERALQAPVFGGKSHLEQLKEVGTDLQLISPRPYQQMHSEKPDRIVRWWIEENNTVIARQCKAHPDVFRGVCGLPQYAGMGVSHAVEELERCVRELGFVGCLLNPDPMEGEGPTPPALGDEYWYPLYEKLVELDVPALIHSAGCRSPRESYSLHFVNEESTAVIGLCSSRVFQDFPRLKIMVSHGGGAIPYQIGRFRAARWRQKGAEEFDTALRRLYFDTCLYSREALELLFKVVGTDRCLFGTERPGTGTAQDPGTGKWSDDLKPVIESIEWLSEADRRKIFEENARAVYRLEVGATPAA
jgi:OH-DDVA meta-cleavage compound hydrolase